jgi:putative membrane protein
METINKQMIKQIKTSVLLVSVSILLAIGAACSNEPGSNGTASSEPIVKTDPANPASDKGDAVITGGDLTFVIDAAPSGMGEIELGKLAASKAQSAEVKAFGQKMVEDHSKAIEDVKMLMVQKKVLLPSDMMPTHIETMNNLSKLSGADFDKEYVKAMVQAHEKDVAAYENVSKTAADADVKAFAAKRLPTLKTHLETIKGMADKMGVKP